MPSRLKITILFDLYHNEMLDPFENEEFSEFLRLLKQENINLLKNDTQALTLDILNDVDVLIIGNPINDFFSPEEVKNIEDYVRMGGSLFLISEYGSDYLQKTNLNDIARKFGFYFSTDIVKEKNGYNQNCQSVVSIKSLNHITNELTSHVRNLIIGGSCSLLLLNRNSQSFLKTNERTWTEKYDSLLKTWKESDNIEGNIIIGAYAEYGKGKVIGIGDIDLFSNEPNIGINARDNYKLVLNLLNWLREPVKERKTNTWMLDQIGAMQFQIKEVFSKLNYIIETLEILEKRISIIENTSFNYADEEIYDQILEKNDI